MKKLTILIILLFSVGSSYAQNQFRISATGGWFGHQVDAEFINHLGASPGDNNHGNTNYQLGIDYVKMLSKKRASLIMGLSYGKWSYGYYYTYRTDSRYYDDYSKTEVTQSSTYWAIGLLLREKILIVGKSSLGILIGGQYNDGLSFKEDIIKYKDEAIVADLNTNNKGYFAMLVKAGISYHQNINEKLGLFLEPTLAVGYEHPFGRGAYANITAGISIF